MQIEMDEIRCRIPESSGKYIRGTGMCKAFILPFREEEGCLVYDIRNRISLEDLFFDNPETFFERVQNLPALFSLLEEFFIAKKEIAWAPDLLFDSPVGEGVCAVWLPGEERESPEIAFHQWSSDVLKNYLETRESSEEKLLLAVRLCQAFNGKRSFSESISILADSFQERRLKKEEKRRIENDSSFSEKIKNIFKKDQRRN